MPSLSRVTSSFALAALIVLGSCTSPFGPSDIAGTYVLVRAGGNAMPGPVTVEGGIVLQIVYDTLVLHANGSTHFAREYTGLPPSSGFGGATADGTFEIDGSEIVLTPPPGCDAMACGLAHRRMRRAPGGLKETDPTFGVLEFSRVGAAP